MLEMFKAARTRWWAPEVQPQTIFHTPLCGLHSRETCVAGSCRLDRFAAAGSDPSRCVNALYGESYYLGAHNGSSQNMGDCFYSRRTPPGFFFCFCVVMGLNTCLHATTAGQRLIHAFNPPLAPVINWWVHQLTLDCTRMSRLTMSFLSAARTRRGNRRFGLRGWSRAVTSIGAGRSRDTVLRRWRRAAPSAARRRGSAGDSKQQQEVKGQAVHLVQVHEDNK